jgi:hypothetical protein
MKKGSFPHSIFPIPPHLSFVMIRESNLLEFSRNKVATLSIFVILLVALTFTSTIGSLTHTVTTTGLTLDNRKVSIVVRVCNHIECVLVVCVLGVLRIGYTIQFEGFVIFKRGVDAAIKVDDMEYGALPPCNEILHGKLVLNPILIRVNDGIFYEKGHTLDLTRRGRRGRHLGKGLGG